MDEQEFAAAHPQWEHHIEYIEARRTKMPQMQEFLARYYPGQKVPIYAVQAILPRINQLGEQGWELVQIVPVEPGENGDIRTGGERIYWSNTYLCAFKRLKRSAEL